MAPTIVRKFVFCLVVLADKGYDSVEIIEANACVDHIHMLLTVPPKMAISRFMGILKRKSTLMIFDCFMNLKYKYGN